MGEEAGEDGTVSAVIAAGLAQLPPTPGSIAASRHALKSAALESSSAPQPQHLQHAGELGVAVRHVRLALAQRIDHIAQRQQTLMKSSAGVGLGVSRALVELATTKGRCAS